MPIDSINTGFQTQFNTPGAAPAAERGSFMGHTVAVQDSPESLLADAAEELGFSVDRTKEYEVGDRKQRDKASLSQFERVKLYQELMHKAGKGRKISELVESLKQTGARESAEKKALGLFPDPSDAWCALLEAAEELEAGGADPSLVAGVKAAADRLEQARGPEIRAGIQGAVAARDFEGLDDGDALRDLYRGTVGEFSSVNEVFSEIHGKYGDNFTQAMDFLFAAISADIGSEVPSMGKAHLESVHAKLGLVRLTQSAYKLCDAQVTRWKTVHGMADSPITPMSLLGDVLGLRGKSFLSAGNIRQIVDKAGAPDPEKEVLFTQDLLKTVRDIPVALYDDEAGRMTVLTAVQDAVDEAVSREDEWLASMEG